MITNKKRIKMFEPVIEDEDIEAVVKALRSGWLAHGPEVEAFEKEFAEYIRRKICSSRKQRYSSSYASTESTRHRT